MKAFQRDFIEFAIARGVLKFGEFTLKSGRVSPYFSTRVYLTVAVIWLSWAAFTRMH